MAEEHDKRSIELTGEDLRSLSLDSLRALDERFGVEVSIKSTRKAIDAILVDLNRTGDFGVIAEFTRGFDRTSGGYNRYYDRDIATLPAFEEVVLPQADEPGP